MPRKPIITLTTDFGLSDHFVGVIKGIILGINPEVEIVDICHDVSAYDIFDAAFMLVQSYRHFPTDTIHMVIVDPGVGTARRPLLARTIECKFVAPDNGVLSLVYEREENIEVRHITADHYFLNPVSNTFHGRDVFAPVAGWLSKWVEADKFGEPITDYVKFTAPKPKRLSENFIKGVVLKVDRFGNLITNLTAEDIPDIFSPAPPAFKIAVGNQEITSLNLAYTPGKPSEVFAIVGSSGFLEVATSRGSASKILNVGRGAEVGVTWDLTTGSAG